MIFAVDIGYREDVALSAGLVFADWASDAPAQQIVYQMQVASDYIPGEFYRRELPCILALLGHLAEKPDTIVIDGYVSLGDDQRPGLGMKLWDALGGTTPVIGVAKTSFAETPPETQVFRGGSKMSLFVTAVGLPLEAAKANILAMAGPFRIPTLLKRVDQLSRGLA